MKFAIAWIVTAIVFLGLDAIWLSQMSKRLYRPLIGDLLAPKVELAAALAFYVIYVSGIVFFAVAPALERGGMARALLCGAALGFVAYATYDLTNQATLRGWDVRVTLADLAWGAFVSAVSAAAAYWVAVRVS
jgi:uncharacterized membrane protein